MDKEMAKKVLAEVDRFREKLQIYIDKGSKYGHESCKYRASAKRASMDVTRILAEMRRG